MNTNYDIEATAMMINLAMRVETGTISYEQVMNTLSKDRDVQKAVFIFWSEFNDMTRNALIKFTKWVTHQVDLIEHLERCYKKELKNEN